MGLLLRKSRNKSVLPIFPEDAVPDDLRAGLLWFVGDRHAAHGFEHRHLLKM
jgi:hypothetical protein